MNCGYLPTTKASLPLNFKYRWDRHPGSFHDFVIGVEKWPG